MTSKLSKETLQKIQSGEIRPRPKWHFALKNILFWFVFVISIALGARMFGAVLFVFSRVDFLFFLNSPVRLFSFMVSLFPFVWFSAFLLFVLLAVFGLHKTHGGYRISIKKLAVANILVSLIIGLGLFFVGDGERIERQARAVPFYQGVDEKREAFWGRPENGRLVGKIIGVESSSFQLEDPRGNTWSVTSNEDVNLNVDDHVRISGKSVGQFTFEAQEIFLWEPGRKPPRKGENPPPHRREFEKVKEKNS